MNSRCEKEKQRALPQRSPRKPSAHVQVKSGFAGTEMSGAQVAPFLHGLDAQGLVMSGKNMRV